MNLKNWKQSYHALKTEAGITRLTLAGCSVALALLAYNAVTQKSTVIIQPWGMQKTGWVTENNASQSYKEAWGYSLAQMLGNVSPGNLDFISKRLAPLLPSALYQSTMTALKAQTIMMKENRVTTTYDIKEVVFEKSSDKVFVYGDYYSKTPSVKPKKEKRTYEFKINMESYLPQIIAMDTYADEPHTKKKLEEMEEHKRNLKKKEKKLNRN